jgi:hypothetical protein
MIVEPRGEYTKSWNAGPSMGSADQTYRTRRAARVRELTLDLSEISGKIDDQMRTRIWQELLIARNICTESLELEKRWSRKGCRRWMVKTVGDGDGDGDDVMHRVSHTHMAGIKGQTPIVSLLALFSM